MEGDRRPPPSQIRKVSSWTESFFELTENLPSPPLFKKWAAISAVAGALERKVWVQTSIDDQFPNLYMVLVGPPGGGKSVVTSLVKRMWNELEGHHIASDAISPASLRDELREAERSVMLPGLNLVKFNSLKIAIDELGVLIPAYERELINQLTAWFDNQPFKERKRTKELNYKIDKPQINLLGGCTPSYLRETLPEGAWDQGFCSRIIFIYSGETYPTDLFKKTLVNSDLYAKLISDLQQISKLYGEIKFTQEAADAFITWHMNRGEPRPEHPKLQSYNTRRSVHILKLCIVACVSRGNDLVITLEDYQQAMDWLAEAELYMPEIFKAIAATGNTQIIDEFYHFTFQIYTREKRPVVESRLVAWLAERLPWHAVKNFLETMVRAKIVQKDHDPKLGDVYTPKSRKHI